MLRRRRTQATANEGIVYRSILHIGPEWVHALVTEIRPENVLIIGAAREPRMDAGQQIQASMLASVCEDALRRAEDMTEKTIGALVVPDVAIIGIPISHIHSLISSYRLARSQPGRQVSERELTRLLKGLYHVAEQQVEAAFGPGRCGSALRFLDSKVIQVQVDGRAVTTPLGFQGGQIEVSAAVLFADGALMDELLRLATYLKLDIIPVAVPWAVASAVNKREAIGLVLDTQESWLFLVQENVVVAMDRCDYGSDKLGADLAATLEMPRWRSDILQAAYWRGELDDALRAWLEESMRSCVGPWLEAVEGVLGKMVRQAPVPTYVCFLELSLPFPILDELLYTWLTKLPLARFPTVRRLVREAIPGVSERAGTIGEDPSDAVALALAHYAGRRQRESGDLDAELRRTIMESCARG